MPSVKFKNDVPGTEQTKTSPECYHCGLPCDSTDIRVDEKHFCCQGCLVVYELLSENGLCQYYDLNRTPGITVANGNRSNFAFLDDEDVQRDLLSFNDGKSARVTFSIPQMHCSSCIWLLENLPRLNGHISSSRVDFLRKELGIQFQIDQFSLRQLVELLHSLGYEPVLQSSSSRPTKTTNQTRSLYLKIGIAGFAFGNIMLLSFPEYLSSGTLEPLFKQFFGYINILLALPVFFYSSTDYFKSAWRALRYKNINIDLPISIGIVTLFVRSVWEIVSANGAGYMDSFVALVFLLLIGKLFQQKTYETLSFERDYRSFFPISVSKIKRGKEETIPLRKLQVGDRIIIRNQEIIPADSILISDHAKIDYSFVTGEAYPAEKSTGDLIYAGGRQVGAAIEVDVVKEVSQSYLTQLWNNDAFSKGSETGMEQLVNRVSKHFTLTVMMIAAAAALYWLPQNAAMAINVFTAVLIIACPCALALASPFTLGNALRILGKNHLYLKSTRVIESLAKITTIVFDKTGTLTQRNSGKVAFVPAGAGEEMSDYENHLVAALVHQSAHPLSRQIFDAVADNPDQPFVADSFEEFPGRGIQAVINGHQVRAGSADFLNVSGVEQNGKAAPTVFIEIDGQLKGYFQLENQYRPAFARLISALRSYYDLAILSGDNDSERSNLTPLISDANLHFNQTPQNKLDYILTRQKNGETVLMVGDGLNDAGALKQSDVGIALTEDLNTFSPACDAIYDASNFNRLANLLTFSKRSMNIVMICFAVSFLYNIIGLSFAVQGLLSPLVSAVLMPISSISVILISTGATHLVAKKLGLIQSSFIDFFTDHNNSTEAA